jgi:hypothetical protein
LYLSEKVDIVGRFTVDYSKLPDDSKPARKGKAIKEGYKILYVLLLHIDDREVVKIGITSNSIEQRVLGILGSCYTSYRYFPYCKPKRFTQVKDAEDKEALLLEYFSSRRYYPSKSFGGHTEIVDVPIDEVVEAYDLALQGKLVLS